MRSEERYRISRMKLVEDLKNVSRGDGLGRSRPHDAPEGDAGIEEAKICDVGNFQVCAHGSVH